MLFLKPSILGSLVDTWRGSANLGCFHARARSCMLTAYGSSSSPHQRIPRGSENLGCFHAWARSSMLTCSLRFQQLSPPTRSEQTLDKLRVPRGIEGWRSKKWDMRDNTWGRSALGLIHGFSQPLATSAGGSNSASASLIWWMQYAIVQSLTTFKILFLKRLSHFKNLPK
jgi:hypothetical protein